MEIAEYVGNGVVIVEPAGRLTAETVAFFSHAISRRIERGRNRIILDLQNINYIDSAGLGAMVHAYTSCSLRGGRLVLVHVYGKNRELLRITKLLTVFDVYVTTLEAERSFVSPPDAVVM